MFFSREFWVGYGLGVLVCETTDSARRCLGDGARGLNGNGSYTVSKRRSVERCANMV